MPYANTEERDLLFVTNIPEDWTGPPTRAAATIHVEM